MHQPRSTEPDGTLERVNEKSFMGRGDVGGAKGSQMVQHPETMNKGEPLPPLCLKEQEEEAVTPSLLLLQDLLWWERGLLTRAGHGLRPRSRASATATEPKQWGAGIQRTQRTSPTTSQSPTGASHWPNPTESQRTREPW